MTTIAAFKDKTVEPSIGNALPHFLPILVFPLIFAAAALGGWWLLAPFLFFISASTLDTAFGKEDRNMNPKTTPEASLVLYNLSVWLWAILWPATLIFTLWQIFMVGQHAWWESVLLAIILATEGQAVFIAGHEMIHRRSAWERYLGEFLLASGSYPHYATEHFYIHHAYVGTPLDVGSAFKGQSFWHYFPRELLHNLTGAWAMARRRMTRTKKPVWHYSNPFWRYGIETAGWYAFVYAMGGWLIVLIYVLLCLGNVFSMKVSNYIQHYGLRRIRLPNGRFEKVQPRHSWSANDKFSKWMFFNFQRHADHHMTASRHYPLLQHYGAEASPQMPASHGQMFILALKPKRWFETIDPLVDQWREQFYPQIKDWRAYDSRVAQMRPEAFDVIVEVFQVAPRLADAIEHDPELLDSLQSREFTDLEIPGGFGPDPEAEFIARSGLVRVYWLHEFGITEMKEQLAEAPVQDSADAAQIVRNWTNHKTFQVAMHTLRRNLTPTEASHALSNIAEAAVTSVLAASVEDIEDRSYQLQNTAVAVIALGDLASKEATACLALELVMLHDGTHDKFVSDLMRRFGDALTNLTDSSLLFKQHTAGERAITEYTFAEWSSKFGSEDGNNDLLELTRARCIYVAGDPLIEKTFENLRRDILSDNSLHDPFVAQLNGEPTTGESDALTPCEAAEWGIMSIERAARVLGLAHITKLSILQSENTSTAVSIFEEAQSQGIIDNETCEELVDTARLWRNIASMQRLALSNFSASDQLNDTTRAALAFACKLKDYDALVSAVGQAAKTTRDFAPASLPTNKV